MKLFRTPTFFRWIFPRRKWGFSSSHKKVYLTFDDGPTPELTEWIMDELAKHNIKATFFCVGSNVKSHPELLVKMREEGHIVANHTMRHEKGTSVKKADYLVSIAEADELIKSDLFRPPYGRLSIALTPKIIKKYKIIMWTWLSYDYDKSVSVETILQQAERIKAGDILVLHDNEKITDRVKQILPSIIEMVHKKGLSFDRIT
ncbi:MAG: peptidoglycan/xylan/chitin deacetylase (PgdA/CDA1 family) [Flavobacteriaceae bacterium]